MNNIAKGNYYYFKKKTRLYFLLVLSTEIIEHLNNRVRRVKTSVRIMVRDSIRSSDSTKRMSFLKIKY